MKRFLLLVGGGFVVASNALGGAGQACHTGYRKTTDAGFRMAPGGL